MNDLKEIKEIINNGSLEQISTLLDQFPDLVFDIFNKETYWPTSLLLIAVETRDTNKVKLIIKHGAEVANQPRNLISTFLSCTKPYYIKLEYQLLQLLVRQGAKFPETQQECINFIKTDLEYYYHEDNVDVIDALIEQGFDPVATEKIAKRSIIAAALERRWGKQRTRIANRFFDLGCQIEGIKGEYYSPLDVAIKNESYKFALKIVKKGIDTTTLSHSLVRTIALDHPEMPLELREALFSGEINHNIKDSEGDTLIHLTCYRNNLDFMSFLMKKGIDINASNENGDTPIIVSIKSNAKKSLTHLIELGADINRLDKKGKTPLDIARKQSGFKQMCAKMIKAGAKTSIELSTTEGNEINLIDAALNNIQTGEPWADKLCALIKQQGKQRAPHWNQLLIHCASNDSSKPSKKWSKEAAALIEVIDESVFRETLLMILPLAKDKRTQSTAAEDTPEMYDYYGDPGYLMTENNTRLLKGLIWAACRYQDQAICHELRDLATHMYKKVSGVGIRNTKLANAALYSLSQIPENAGLKEIVIMRATTKYNSALVKINRVFDQLAKEKGMTADELAELSIPDYGLSEVGLYTQTLGDYRATVRLSAVGKSEFTWLKAEKSQKSVPTVLKSEFADEIKSLKLKVKDLNTATRAHSLRLEQMYLRCVSHKLPDWQSQYMDHKLMGFLSRRLIWRITTAKTTNDVIYTDVGFVNADNKPFKLPETASIILWHPIMSEPAEVLAWRHWLIEHEITQPFKQAHREVYLLTDAERETGDYSLRFANHILKHAQFNALATQRGWKQTFGGYWDGGDENSAYKYIPAYNMDIEFVANRAESYDDCVGTTEVIFSRKKRVKLENIEPLLFSEVMRDVDLFVGVSSIANDPEWHNREIDYWNNTSFGELSMSAKTRHEVLAALIPKLIIASQLRLDGRFLIVEGKVRTYKIHLGSSNILMEPNDSYLCIVAKRSNNPVMLPFEGDTILALILSKAFTLANDSKIRDKTILSQIKPEDVLC